MEIDNAGQCIYNQQEVFNLIMQGVNIDSLYIEHDSELNELLKAYEVKDFNRYINVNSGEENIFHGLRQKTWNMPEKYQKLDIQEYLINRISIYSNPKYAFRLSHELALFEQYNLLDLLRYMKYMTGIFRKNNVVWGIGRGSSVASLCLFLLNVHCVDPVAYDISFDEFLK